MPSLDSTLRAPQSESSTPFSGTPAPHDTDSDRHRVIVLTGPSRAGKTTVCRAVIDEARARHLSVAGVLTDDATTPDGARLQIARDVRTARTHLLASEKVGEDVHAPSAARPPRGGGGPRLGWTFDAEGTAFGRDVLATTLRTWTDVLVVDQIGPLELIDGRGWTVAFDVVGRQRFGLAMVVVNPRVLGEARSRLGACDVLVVDDSTRDDLPAAICATCLPAARRAEAPAGPRRGHRGLGA